MDTASIPLTDLYNRFFNLTEAPFSIAPNPRFLYMSPRYQEALAHLLYGINSGGGFVALTGEVGTGKTTLCHCLLEQIPDDIDIALILNPKLNAIELLANICDELHIDYPENCSSLKYYTDLLNESLLSTYSKGKRTVLMIDEAQNLDLEVLEQVRLLTNLETTETKLLQIILIGQPELKQLLDRDELRQLNQRITARYHLDPLSLAETQAYIKHRLTVSGGSPNLFTDAAIKKIFQLTNGIPRLVNVLCDRSLLGAYAAGNLNVSPKVVKKAALEALPAPKKNKNLPRSIVWIPCLIALLLGLGVYFFANPLNNSIKKSAHAESDIDVPFTSDSEAATDHPQPTGKSAKADEQLSANKTKESEVDKIMLGDKDPQPTTTIASQRQPLKIEKLEPVFDQVIENSAYTLKIAMRQLLKLWNIEPAEQFSTECQAIKSLGLRCLANRGTWQKIVSFNRPAILEFPLAENKTRYGLLTRLENNRPILQIGDQQYLFHLEDFLPKWQGFYLLLWKPPHPDLLYLRPGQNSERVLWLRETLGAYDQQNIKVELPRNFDNTLKDRVVGFQHNHALIEDAVVGPKTIIHLKNIVNAGDFPTLQPDRSATFNENLPDTQRISTGEN